MTKNSRWLATVGILSFGLVGGAAGGPQASECDSAVACRNLGIQLEAKGPKQDVPRAVALYEKACAGGDPTGCTYAGDMYGNGKGVLVDAPKATAFYLKACDIGDWRACQYACERLKKGTGAAIDLAKAIGLCTRSCDNGDPYGCNNLALFYRDGLRVPKDLARAEELFEKACKDKDGLACHNLADIVRGKDPKRAALLEKQACDYKEQAGCDALK